MNNSQPEVQVADTQTAVGSAAVKDYGPGTFVVFYDMQTKQRKTFSLVITAARDYKKGEPVAELMWDQKATWATPQQAGMPATPPDQSVLILTISKVMSIDEWGRNVLQQVKKYMTGYSWMKKDLALDVAETPSTDVA